jgi:putative flippase GtrA
MSGEANDQIDPAAPKISHAMSRTGSCPMSALDARRVGAGLSGMDVRMVALTLLGGRLLIVRILRFTGRGPPHMPRSPSRASGSDEQETVPRTAKDLAQKFIDSSVVRFLIIGGLSFALDLGLLVLLHEALGVELWIATPVAFVVSLVFNFLLQRIFTFQATNHRGISALKYVLLVFVNILVSDLIVTGFDALGWSYVVGKTTSTVLTTVWNYFLYRHWIFKSSESVGTKSS